MLSLFSQSASCLLLCTLALAQRDTQSTRTFRKELIDPTIISVFDDTINGHMRISYVKSDYDALQSSKEPVFVAVIETYVQDGLTFRQSCWTNLTATNENVRLVTLGTDRVVIMWTERRMLLNIYLVNLKACEWQNVTSVTVDLPATRSFDRNVFVIPYDKAFDLMFSNFEACKRRLCRVAYDLEGTRVTGVTEVE